MDTDLVRSAMRGDERAFTEIVNGVADRFLGVAHRILRDPALAEDAVQQALLSAWQDLPDLRDPARFDGWAYRLLIRACYMEVRRRKRWHPTTIVRPIVEPAAPDLIGGIIERERLERGFERLSLEHRAVLVLTYYLDLPSEQVAAALDIAVGTVYVADQVETFTKGASSELRGFAPGRRDHPSGALHLAAAQRALPSNQHSAYAGRSVPIASATADRPASKGTIR